MMRTDCPECPFEASSEKGLKIHYSQRHSGEGYPWIDVVEIGICAYCNGVFENDRGGEYCSLVCANNARRPDNSGASHPNWQGGKVDYPYYGYKWREVREKALERDGLQCRACGIEQSELSSSLHVHHRQPLREFEYHSAANRLDNLVTLCPSCHPKVERGTIEVPTDS